MDTLTYHKHSVHGYVFIDAIPDVTTITQKFIDELADCLLIVTPKNKNFDFIKILNKNSNHRYHGDINTMFAYFINVKYNYELYFLLNKFSKVAFSQVKEVDTINFTKNITIDEMRQQYKGPTIIYNLHYRINLEDDEMLNSKFSFRKLSQYANLHSDHPFTKHLNNLYIMYLKEEYMTKKAIHKN